MGFSFDLVVLTLYRASCHPCNNFLVKENKRNEGEQSYVKNVCEKQMPLCGVPFLSGIPCDVR